MNLDLHSGLRILLALVPVCLFLVTLIYLDSYKLLKLRRVMYAVGAGCLAAGASYGVNLVVFEYVPMAIATRIIAPIIEEILKGVLIVVMIRTRRVGFLVDAAILGFAAGTGFALVENVYYLQAIGDSSVALWVIRGLGTAVMHGGTTAMFAIISKSLTQAISTPKLQSFLPGLGVAILVHAVFNTFFFKPMVQTALVVVILPPALSYVFGRSEGYLQKWLGSGFDLDTELLRVIHSGQFSTSPVGLYLMFLRQYFPGDVLADMLAYLRLHTELGMRAKGMLMMRANGFPMKPDPFVKEGLSELRYLEKTIGKTGMLSLMPMLRSGEQDLFQLKLLEQA